MLLLHFQRASVALPAVLPVGFTEVLTTAAKAPTAVALPPDFTALLPAAAPTAPALRCWALSVARETGFRGPAEAAAAAAVAPAPLTTAALLLVRGAMLLCAAPVALGVCWGLTTGLGTTLLLALMVVLMQSAGTQSTTRAVCFCRQQQAAGGKVRTG
jgi:hypothetical protein